jgi:hypothetical protein
MKRSNSIILIVSVTCGFLAMATQAILAQTIFSDNFTTDSSLQPGWYNLNDSTTSSSALNPTAGQGLELVSTASGHVAEIFNQFSPTLITPSVGQTLTLSVNFNTVGVSGNTGGLVFGLYNTQGSAPNGDETTASGSGSTATTGATTNHTGYFQIAGYNTSAGTSTKLYSRMTGATEQNELGYYSRMNSDQYTQLQSNPASGNANLADGNAYTLNYSILNTGSGNTITTTIMKGVTTLDDWTYTDASSLNTSFNELDFGLYNKNGASLDINTTLVTVSIVPEPSTFALAGLGLIGLVAGFRRR